MLALQLLANDVGVPAVAEEAFAQPVLQTIERRLALGRAERHRARPGAGGPAALRQRFDRLVATRTSFATLDRLLARMQANRGELLVVLDRPEVPLHTNDAENDLRAVVTRRKLSGGTRSDAGRACRDAFLGLF